MEKVTIEDLAPYLAHKLEGMEYTDYFYLDSIGDKMQLWKPNYGRQSFPRRPLPRRMDCKPIMYPLSALTEPILEGGKIPIVELAKICIPKYDNYTLKEDYADLGHGYALYFHEIDCSFEIRRYFDDQHYSCNCYVPNQLEMFKQLYAWHFWLGDQSYFEKGLLINKRT